MHKLPVGVLGASGYAGRELCALIEGHPSLELAFAAANGQRGQTLRVGKREVTFIGAGEAPLGDAALVFSALPHGASLEWVEKARNAGAKAVDLSSDLRIGHGRTDVPYGLTELRRNDVVGADLVANPKCRVARAFIDHIRQRGKRCDGCGLHTATRSSIRRDQRGFPRVWCWK